MRQWVTRWAALLVLVLGIGIGLAAGLGGEAGLAVVALGAAWAAWHFGLRREYHASREYRELSDR